MVDIHFKGELNDDHHHENEIDKKLDAVKVANLNVINANLKSLQLMMLRISFVV